MEDPFTLAYDKAMLGHYRGLGDEALAAEIQRLGDAADGCSGGAARYDLALAETARDERRISCTR